MNIKRDVREDGIIVSTVKPDFLAWYGKYETAISLDGSNDWKVVKSYDSKIRAIQGHKEFLKMDTDELINLKQIDML